MTAAPSSSASSIYHGEWVEYEDDDDDEYYGYEDGEEDDDGDTYGEFGDPP